MILKIFLVINGAFFDQVHDWKGLNRSLIGTTNPDLDSVGIFSDAKPKINHTLGVYNPIYKTINLGNEQYILVNSAKSVFLTQQDALTKTTNDYRIEKDEIPKTNLFEHYHKAYFDNGYLYAMYDWSRLENTGEFAYYKVYEALLRNYFPDKLVFSVQSQSKQGNGIWDFTVRILDPRTAKLTQKAVGINKVGGDLGTDLFHQLHTLIEAKKPSGSKLQWNAILAQIQKYHTGRYANTNAFSIAIDGTKIAFFIYIHDIHHNYVNKGNMFNGFLCLYVVNEGVEVVPQTHLNPKYFDMFCLVLMYIMVL